MPVHPVHPSCASTLSNDAVNSGAISSVQRMNAHPGLVARDMSFSPAMRTEPMNVNKADSSDECIGSPDTSADAN